MLLLSVVMLWWIVNGGATTIDPSLHLISKIASGRFGDIDLKSITYYNVHQVVLFEGDHKYFIPTSDITQTSMTIPDTYLRWDETELASAKPSLELHQGQSIKSVYFQCLQCAGTSFRAYINTGKYLYSMHLNTRYVQGSPLSASVMQKKHLQHGQENFTIAHDQRADDSVGYVIHKDINQATHYFVIYQLMVQNWNVYLQDYGTDDIRFHQYHLERTDKPSQVKLVHSSRYEPNQPNRLNSEERNSLFNSQPRGFMLEGRLYLFDGALGCVYIVEWDRLDLWNLHQKADQDELLMKRVNVPYEQFFKPYGQEQKFSDNFGASADRCETTNRVGGGRPSGLDGQPVPEPVSNGVKQGNLTGGSGQIPQETKTSGIQWIIYLGAALVIAILVIAVTIVFVRKIKQRSKKITSSNKKKSETPAHKQRIATPTKGNNSTPRNTSASATSTSVKSSSSPVPKKETPGLKNTKLNSSIGQPMGSSTVPVTSVTKDFSDLLVASKQQQPKVSSSASKMAKLASSSTALPMTSFSSSINGPSGQSGTIRSAYSKAPK